jgi:biopolymer transport protein ExbD
MAKIKSSIDDEPAESFTSMIDIVFLLLIFFILQPFKKPEMKLRSELPKDTGQAPSISTPRPSIRLQINRGLGANSCVYFVNDQTPRSDTIWKALKTESQEDTTVPVSLMPDPEVQFRFVLNAIDQCYKAGMTDVKFAAPPSG